MHKIETDERRITVLGGGAWGATLADLLARLGHHVAIWDRNGAVLEQLRTDRHPRGVPELRLHESVRLEPQLEMALERVDVVFLVVPSQAIRPVARELREVLGRMRPVIAIASKGLDGDRMVPLTDVIEEELPGCPVVVVSGPCIAREVAQEIPTSLVAACSDVTTARLVQGVLSGGRLRVYTQDDPLGVELAGALKNIIAIAAGIGDGLGFGANTKSALLTRGLAEMNRLAMALGARPETLAGLSGVGDLVVTCFSPHSRNRTFGEHLGKGLSADQAREKVGMTVEGEPTARVALRLAEQRGIPMPITEAVVRVCEGTWSVPHAVERLMTRDLRPEFD